MEIGIAMARKVIYECDMAGCEQTRKPSNHWFVAFKACGNALNIQPLNEEEITIQIESGIVQVPVILCGEACVHKYISQNLASLHPTIKVSLCPEGCCCFKCNETRANEECTEYAKTCIVEFNSDNKVEIPDFHGGNVAQDDFPF
jgi:hypothetical protein